jgi:hypothetical protein
MISSPEGVKVDGLYSFWFFRGSKDGPERGWNFLKLSPDCGPVRNWNFVKRNGTKLEYFLKKLVGGVR